MAPITAKVRAVFDKISKVIYNMDMKFSKEFSKAKVLPTIKNIHTVNLLR